MEYKLLLEKPYVELAYDEEHQVLITKWKGSLDVEQVRSVIEFKVDFVREHSIRYNLNDHTELKVLSLGVQQYLVEEGHTALEKVGLKKIAVKLAKDIFAQATVRKVNRLEYYNKLQIKVFSSYEDAYEWLLSE